MSRRGVPTERNDPSLTGSQSAGPPSGHQGVGRSLDFFCVRSQVPAALRSSQQEWFSYDAC